MAIDISDRNRCVYRNCKDGVLKRLVGNHAIAANKRHAAVIYSTDTVIEDKVFSNCALPVQNLEHSLLKYQSIHDSDVERGES